MPVDPCACCAGGTFALYALLCRHSGIRLARQGSPDAADSSLSNYRSVPN